MGRYILFVGIVILIFVDVFEMTGAASISTKTEILESNGEELDGLAAEGGELVKIRKRSVGAGIATTGGKTGECGRSGHWQWLGYPYIFNGGIVGSNFYCNLRHC